MKAVGLYKYLPIDHPESLLDLEVETPRPAGRDLLVGVKAISVNPVDTKRRAPKDLVETTPKILGCDASGIVEAVGPEVTLFKPGDPVYYAGSVIRQGSNSEFQLVDERIVGRKPASLPFAHAAALPLTTLTAWELMFERMGISKTGAHAGKSVLILGGAGGVGSMAIQLAKKLAKLKVTASASRAESIDWCKALGADEIVDHRQPIEGEYDYVLCFSSSDAYWNSLSENHQTPGQGRAHRAHREAGGPGDPARQEHHGVPRGDVHALHVPDPGHGSAACAAGRGGRIDRGERAERHPEGKPGRRSTPPTCAARTSCWKRGT